MTELLLPAGSMQAGLAAFEGGADAIYLGFTRFSARKEAKNFTFDEFRRITTYAREHRKQVIIALNTLLKDDDIQDAYDLLKQASFIGCDGIIIQDLGLARLCRRDFPNLELHASTQLAVHTAEGVREMQSLGFKQVVLSRELTIEEIGRIRKACPDVKLEVFIHGALCYGFSGLCMASAKLCGRSANGGACAQICRSWFEIEKDPLRPAELSPKPIQRKAWWLSMSDLDGTKAVKRLQDMGIDMLKVEGRMKAPAYTLAAAKYYRALLDGQEDTSQLKKDLETVFARRMTGGWLTDYGRTEQDFTPRTVTLGSTSYPRHRGIKIGKVQELTRYGAVVTLTEPVALRDGISYFTAGDKEPVGVVQFGLSTMRDAYRKYIQEAIPSQTVIIQIPEGQPEPKVGQEVYCISRHDQTLPVIGKELTPATAGLETILHLEQDKLSVETRLGFLGKKVVKRYPIAASRAQKSRELQKEMTELFSQNDKSYFSLKSLTIDNQTGLQDDNLFYPLSQMKTMRRDWYKTLDMLLEKYLAEPLERKTGTMETKELLPLRNLLSDRSQVPWLDVMEIAKEEEPEKRMYMVLSRYYLPLAPVMFKEAEYYQALDGIVQKLQNSGNLDKVRFGLNNIAQVRWAKRHPECKVFCDIYLYLANSFTAESMQEELGDSLVGGYLWLETQSFTKGYWPFIPTPVPASFNIPLFISRSCFRHDSLLLECENCPHRGSWYLEQMDRRLHVMVKDCITIITQV
ncbi:MAG: peptidase U32 family protein [Sphaerochaetaceae bacterium]|nr:peptidase U32 family protein [Sphaerochaetaceae bacterium]